MESGVDGVALCGMQGTKRKVYYKWAEKEQTMEPKEIGPLP